MWLLLPGGLRGLGRAEGLGAIVQRGLHIGCWGKGGAGVEGFRVQCLGPRDIVKRGERAAHLAAHQVLEWGGGGKVGGDGV